MSHTNRKTQTDDAVAILVVEDDSFLRDLLFRHLTRQGHKVSVAETGVEAIEQIRVTDFQMALIDILLPDMDGLELVDGMKKIQSDVILIMMTGHPSLETALQAMKKGVQDYLLKPFKLEQLDEVIQKCLEGRKILLENKRLQDELEEAREQLKKYEALIRQPHLVGHHPAGEVPPDHTKYDAYRFQSIRTRETTIQDRIDKLALLKEEGLISEDDFEVKHKQLVSMSGKVTANGAGQQKKE